MNINIQVKRDHHQRMPNLEFHAKSWPEANEKFTYGLNNIHKENEKYIANHERQNALVCEIINFKLVLEGPY